MLKDVAARRHKAAEPLLAQAKASADKWDKPAAKAAYEQALKVDPDSTAARDGLKFVATIGESPASCFATSLATQALRRWSCCQEPALPWPVIR